MTTQALANLQEITDRLVPHMWLKLNREAFEGCFGLALHAGADSKPALDVALAFAKQNSLVMLFDEAKQAVEFSRVYVKQDEDV